MKNLSKMPLQEIQLEKATLLAWHQEVCLGESLTPRALSSQNVWISGPAPLPAQSLCSVQLVQLYTVIYHQTMSTSSLSTLCVFPLMLPIFNTAPGTR